MKKRTVVVVFCVLVALAMTLNAQEPGPKVDSQRHPELPTTRTKAPISQTHRDLDWQAPKRWVHVDTVDPKKALLFENARRAWLAVLHQDGQVLGDGRPLFWQARGGPVYTYFTFYPFRRWAEMDTRAEMIDQMEKVVGEEAVKTYDLGDAALVPPHYSQIWRRVPRSDITSSGSASLTEVTNGVPRSRLRELGGVRAVLEGRSRDPRRAKIPSCLQGLFQRLWQQPRGIHPDVAGTRRGPVPGGSDSAGSFATGLGHPEKHCSPRIHREGLSFAKIHGD